MGSLQDWDKDDVSGSLLDKQNQVDVEAKNVIAFGKKTQNGIWPYSF